MCGRFSQFAPVSDLVALFEIGTPQVDSSGHSAHYNVAPTQEALVVATSPVDTNRKLGTMRWGLVPRWAKDPSIGNRMINARTDRVATSNAYRAAFARRRCIVPVDGFYEWAAPGQVSPGTKPVKTPFHIHASDRVPLALAGLWEIWHDADDRPMRSFTILTCDANEAMKTIHHRMPVILAPTDWARWLEPTPLSESDQARLLVPAANDLLVFDQVSTKVNRPTNDDPEVIAPVESSA